MSNLTINANSIYDRVIRIGRQTENLVSSITFNVNMWIEEYGAGECVLNVRRNGDANAYPVPMTIADGMTTWTITDTDTARKGRGEIQLKYTVGDKVKTSPIFTISCGESLIGDGEPPSGYEDWLTELGEMTAQVEAAKTSASASAQSAASSEQTATDKATLASQKAAAASESATTASNKASEASTSASTASAKATESAQSASQALSYKTDAESAKTASQTAQGLAESARDTAVSAKTDAESARDDAESARDEAQSAVASISGALAEKAPVITDTASGSIASFSDGADNLPLKSLVVDINPVQDLHGQENPYPAGGGKNLTNLPNVAETTKNGVTYSISNGVVSINGTCNSGFTIFNSLIGPFPSDSYTASVNLISGTASTINNSFNFYDSENTRKMVAFGIQSQGQYPIATSFAMSIVKADIVINDGAVFNNAKFSFQLEKGSSATSFAPYENLCPISGWTEVDVEQRGVNVWDEEWEFGYLNINNGSEVATNNSIRMKNYIGVVPNADYYFSCTGKSDVFRVVWFDENKSFISASSSSVLTNKVITAPSGAHYMRCFFSSSYGTTYNHDISINYPGSDHSYHPYTGRSINITLGQTVYGGKLDVLTGELVIDRGIAVFDGTEEFTNNWFPTIVCTKKFPKGDANGNSFVNSHLPSLNTACNYASNGKTTFQFSKVNEYWGVSSADELKVIFAQQYANGMPVTICYPLAEPLEIQLSANQINSLYGVNNIWADSGDTEVEYRADTKAWIQRKIAEAIASLT